MIPRRPAQIFRSRWSALFWAAGVLVTAYQFVPSSPPPHPDASDQPANRQDATLTDAAGDPVSNADLAALKQFVDQP